MSAASRRAAALATALLMGAAALGGVGAASAAVPPSAGPIPTLSGSAEQDSFEAEVLRLTNDARAHSRKCGGKIDSGRGFTHPAFLIGNGDDTGHAA